MSNSLVNLFNPKKIISKNSYILKWSIYNNNSEEFYALDGNNHLLKSKHVKTGAYFKALIVTKVDLRI